MKRTQRCVLTILLGLAQSSLNSTGLRAADLASPLKVTPLTEATFGAVQPEPRPGMFRLAVFEFFPRVSASVFYDDNIRIQSTNEQEDVVWIVSPGVSFVASDAGEGAVKSLTIEYSPGFVFFTDHDEHNTIDHAARLAAVWPMAKLTLGVSQTFSRSESAVAEVGDRVERRAYDTALTSAYQLSEKSSFQVDAGLAISEYERLNGAKTYSNNDWVNYQVTSKINVGFGMALGYVDVELGPNQTYEQALFRAVYVFTDKVNFTAAVGGEWRQYRGDVPDEFELVFSVTGTYRPFEGTTISLEGHRQNEVSAIFANQNVIRSGASVALRQRILEKLAFNLAGSYDNADYHSAVLGAVATRSDDHYSVRVAIDATIRERWTAGIFYLYRRNVSNDGSFDFDNNQFGLQTSWSY